MKYLNALGLIALLVPGTLAAQDVTATHIAIAAEPASIGWATVEGDTTGGAAAALDQIHVVTSRAALVAALGGDNATNAGDDTPAIIFVSGTIDLTEDDAGNPQGAAAFAEPEYDEAAYIATYDPEVYGREAEPEGPLEEARERSEQAQNAHTMVRIGSNKTLIGLKDARIINGTLLLKEVENVIIRNITFEDSWDFFPQWDATDGSQGNWNAEYDLIGIEQSTHVWIDHCSFSDGARHDDDLPPVFGRVKQHHDGLVDIKTMANYITLSNNRFFDHDKVHVIGSSDSRTQNIGHLRVTITGNWYDNVRQRTPRVRFGEVHVYGNLFTPRADGPYSFSYAIGAGKESRTLSEANLFALPAAIEPGSVFRHYRGEMAQDNGSLVNGKPADLLALYNAANPDKPLADSVDWTPPYAYQLPDPAELAVSVRKTAGAGHLLPH
ncbi:polysaccharide lyase family 1 protein [Loktanella agnita]|uniref:pectate lyase family protein n=1 Tax=Loktanella agnita TaxID=287097 RepID=UPI0039893E7F